MTFCSNYEQNITNFGVELKNYLVEKLTILGKTAYFKYIDLSIIVAFLERFRKNIFISYYNLLLTFVPKK